MASVKVLFKIFYLSSRNQLRRGCIYCQAALKKRRKAMDPREDVDDMIYCDDWYPSDR